MFLLNSEVLPTGRLEQYGQCCMNRYLLKFGMKFLIHYYIVHMYVCCQEL